MTAVADQPYDVVIIGSGVGGGAVALSLAGSGARILILERGERLPREPQNWDTESVFVEQRYRTHDTWHDGEGKPFRPGQFYYVGGHTKFYGTAMFRFRERDFDGIAHEEGDTRPWPIRYRDLEPWYTQAEKVFGVHGRAGDDPTEPPRSAPFPHGPIPHEPVIAEVFERMRVRGLHPAHMPAAIDFHAGGSCVRCGTCDAFPCKIGAKGDAETRLIDPALKHGNVELHTGCRVRRLIADGEGKRIVAVEYERKGETLRVSAGMVVLSAGAINSAALLLASAHARNPNGLANSSGVVGRYFMNHNCTGLMAISPWRTNTTRYPKTLTLNDYYFGGPGYAGNAGSDKPLGNLQLLGKIQEPMLRGVMPNAPKWSRRWLAQHSVDWYVMSEDLGQAESRVQLRSDGSIVLDWKRSNLKAHRRWVETARRLLKDLGFPVVLSKAFGADSPSHQCGTVRFGDDPATLALDTYCRAWDHDNLYVVDASFFPSSAALNPALTVAAQALRVGAHLKGRL
ncbi:MAG: GMC family oxidoreductase [Betaproteobacteria bacterium]|nr:GMC family oxidoreductase [Betaproteobacteria bacterium]